MTKAKWQHFSEKEIREIFQNSTSYGEASIKFGYSRGGSANETMKKVIKQVEIDDSHFTGQSHQKNTGSYRVSIEDYLNNSRKIKSHALRLRLLAEGYFEHRCQHCNLTEWLGKPIPLELHHIDGKHQNNELSNLEIICPNCHSFTDNYKNKK